MHGMDVAFLVGTSLVVAGVWMFSPAVAVICLGLLICSVSVFFRKVQKGG